MVSSKDLLRIATQAADRAAAFLRTVRRPSSPREWHTKAQADFVTEADRRAERLIAHSLLAATPEATILGEELTPDQATAGLTWIVDPLDGTTNFLHGYPAFAVSIAAARDGRLLAGVIVDVPRALRYHAVLGEGAWLGETRLRVSAIQDPRHALIGTGFPFKHRDQLGPYLRQFPDILKRSSGIRRGGSAALDLADVAAGRLDGFWELALAPWDIAAGALLVREAGGRITDLTGRPIAAEHTAVVAGNPHIHPWLLERLGASASHAPESVPKGTAV